jgi:ankyrin repeat protein
MLLDIGLDVDRFGASGRTALMAAVRLDLREAAMLLLDRGAKLNLGAAASVATLYSEGDVLCKNEGPRSDTPGRTALSYAAELGSPALVMLLLGRGADRTIADKDGHAPEFWAAKRTGLGADEIRMLLNSKK